MLFCLQSVKEAVLVSFLDLCMCALACVCPHFYMQVLMHMEDLGITRVVVPWKLLGCFALLLR